MSLPIFHTDSKDISLLQTNWATQLNPLLANPLSNGIFVKNKVLATGANVINHLLGRRPQGFFITDINASAIVYRSQPFDLLTLTLTSSASAVVNLYVF